MSAAIQARPASPQPRSVRTYPGRVRRLVLAVLVVVTLLAPTGQPGSTDARNRNGHDTGTTSQDKDPAPKTRAQHGKSRHNASHGKRGRSHQKDRRDTQRRSHQKDRRDTQGKSRRDHQGQAHKDGGRQVTTTEDELTAEPAAPRLDEPGESLQEDQARVPQDADARGRDEEATPDQVREAPGEAGDERGPGDDVGQELAPNTSDPHESSGRDEKSAEPRADEELAAREINRGEAGSRAQADNGPDADQNEAGRTTIDLPDGHPPDRDAAVQGTSDGAPRRNRDRSPVAIPPGGETGTDESVPSGSGADKQPEGERDVRDEARAGAPVVDVAAVEESVGQLAVDEPQHARHASTRAANEATPTATPAPEPTATPELTATVKATAIPDPTATQEPVASPELTAIPEPTAIVEATATPELTATLESTAPLEPTAIPEPTVTPELTATPEPAATLEPTVAPEPTTTPESTATPEPPATVEATVPSEPIDTPEATATLESTAPLEPTAIPEPTVTPELTATPEPAATVEATATPELTTTPDPTATLEATSIPEATDTPDPISTPESTATPEPTPTVEATAILESTAIPELLAPSLVTVEAISQNDELRPGEIRDYHFRVINTGEVAATVRFVAANQLPGWTGQIVHVDDAMPDSPVVIAPGRNILVVVAVRAPQDARSGDRNTTTLSVEPAESV